MITQKMQPLEFIRALSSAAFMAISMPQTTLIQMYHLHGIDHPGRRNAHRRLERGHQPSRDLIRTIAKQAQQTQYLKTLWDGAENWFVRHELERPTTVVQCTEVMPIESTEPKSPATALWLFSAAPLPFWTEQTKRRPELMEHSTTGTSSPLHSVATPRSPDATPFRSPIRSGRSVLFPFVGTVNYAPFAPTTPAQSFAHSQIMVGESASSTFVNATPIAQFGVQ